MNLSLKFFTIVSVLFFSLMLNASEKNSDGLKTIIGEDL